MYCDKVVNKVERRTPVSCMWIGSYSEDLEHMRVYGEACKYIHCVKPLPSPISKTGPFPTAVLKG